MIEGTGPRMCVCVCLSLCVEVFVVSAVGTRSLELKPVKQEMTMMMMCKGIQYQTMIHFKSLLDMIQRTRDVCSYVKDRQSELPNNDHRIKKKQS